MMDPLLDKTCGGGFLSQKLPRISPSTSTQNLSKAVEKEQSQTVRPALRGSGSYPTMIRVRTANRKITKRNSDVILTGGGGSMANSQDKKRRLPLHKKKSVYSKATRRKSLENLGLVVRNRCGTAKLQWPSGPHHTEKKETDVFDLLPEGCLQVRQLRMKTPKDEEATNTEKKERGFLECEPKPFPNMQPFCHNSQSSIETSHLSSEPVSAPVLPPLTDWKNKRNISVIVRIRPKQPRERPEKSIVFRTDPNTVIFDPKEKTKDFYFQGVKQSTRNDFGRKRPNRNVSFQYDRVYGPEATNMHIFSETLHDLPNHLIEGFNSTVFAYGATGSGKTYTMIGSNSNPGLIVLMVESLYKRIGEIASDYECDVLCSYLEVYNETIKDLLKPEKELSIREDGKKGIIIPELTFYRPRGPNDLLRLLRNGNKARTQHATDLNSESSRSHAVFEVKLYLKRKQKEVNTENYHGLHGQDNEDLAGLDTDALNKVKVIQSKLVMVDLAGSERGNGATATHSSANLSGPYFMEGNRQREGASINKSLLALANCISALADGKCHIPYRNSKLTRLLKDALSGNCTTVMIANISPSSLSSEDTYNTLKYADRAKNIVGPETKQRNFFLEDLLIEDGAKCQVAELQAKLNQLAELLEVEKLKNERILTQQAMKEQQEREQGGRNSLNSITGRLETGRRSCISNMGGGDADNTPIISPSINVESDAHYLEEECHRESNKECVPTSSKKMEDSVIEDQLPDEIKKYIQLIKERAQVYSEYVQFASKNKLSEWADSCKKLKADMADVLGRLPVSDENYVSFCKLKNEVNNMISASRSSSLMNICQLPIKSIEHPNPAHIQHKKYAIKLKNLTEKLELIRLQCVANNILTLPDGSYMASSVSPHLLSEKLAEQPPPPTVSISLEEYLQFKRLLGEQEGNDKMEQFYQQFSQQINSQLITSGMTLMYALKLVKRLDESLQAPPEKIPTSAIHLDYKDLADFVYGSGHPEVNNSDPNPPRPQTTSMNSLGRRSNLIVEDLHKLKRMVEQPLLIQLTSILGTEEDEGDDEMESDLQDKSGNVDSSHEMSGRSTNPIYDMSSLTYTARRRSYSADKSYEKREYNSHPPMTVGGIGRESSSCINDNDDYEDYYNSDSHHLNDAFTTDLPDENENEEVLGEDDDETTSDEEEEDAGQETGSSSSEEDDDDMYVTTRQETDYTETCTTAITSRKKWDKPSHPPLPVMLIPQRVHVSQSISNNKPRGTYYKVKDVGKKNKSQKHIHQGPVKSKGKEQGTRETTNNSDYDWYTTSTGTTTTTAGDGSNSRSTTTTSGTTCTNTSASASEENVAKRINSKSTVKVSSFQFQKKKR